MTKGKVQNRRRKNETSSGGQSINKHKERKNKELLSNTNESGRRAAPAVVGVCPTCPILSQHNYIGFFTFLF